MTLAEKQRFVPKAVVGGLGATAVDGLKTAMKTAIAAFPALVLAWMVGVVQHPSPIGFGVAAVGFAATVYVASARLRAVRRAQNPELREVERTARAWIDELDTSSRNRGKYLDEVVARSKRDTALFVQWTLESEEHHANVQAKMEAWTREREAWAQADPASRPPEPKPPDLGTPPVFPA
jgi:hypothetical protein